MKYMNIKHFSTVWPRFEEPLPTPTALIAYPYLSAITAISQMSGNYPMVFSMVTLDPWCRNIELSM